MDLGLISAFFIYLGILLVIGFIFYHKSKNADDFMVGNRSINYFVTAVATQASDMGSWLFLGYPGALMISGLIEAWSAIGLIVFMFLNWQFIAPKLRAMTEDLDTPTFSSFFNKRFNDTSGTLAILSAFISLLFFTFYISSGLVGMGLLFESAFNIDYYVGIMFALGAALLYTLIGGFVAVAWCNLFQGLFLLAMIVMVPAYAYFMLPHGMATIITAAQTQNISLSLLPADARSFGQIILLTLGWGLGYFGQPHILINFMGIDDVKKIRYAKYVGITWQVLVLTAAIMLGLISIAYFGNGLHNPELAFVIITKELFTPLLAGFALCGILAATLSSMDSHILVSASTIAEDVYKRLFNAKANEQQVVWASRLGGILISCIALIIACNKSSSVYTLVNYAWSGLGSSFGPLVIAALYWKSATRQAAIAGLLTGSAVAALWPYAMPLLPGFIANFVIMYVVTKLSRN